MIILSQNSFKGIGKYNNDILGNIGNLYYVMDGATALFKDNNFFKTSDLYKYMQLLKQNINDNDTIVNNLKNSIEKSNKALPNIDKYAEYELPTFTISVLKEYNEYIEIYLLCDCFISILYKDGSIENIEDLRFDDFKKPYKQELDNITSLNLDSFETFKLKKPIWQEIRTFANKKDGYPVGSTKEISIEKGIKRKINKDKIDRVLLCSDGLSSALGMPNKKDIFDKKYLENLLKHKTNEDDLTYILLKKD